MANPGWARGGRWLCCLLLVGCSSQTPAPVSDAGAGRGRASVARHAPPAASKPLPPQGGYRVKPGDTLYAIAWLHGLDFRAVAELNGITPPYAIYSGQIIQLDVNNPDGGRYQVKAGDNLSRIARNNGTSLSALIRLNRLKKPYQVVPGQVLLLRPGGASATTARRNPEPGTSSSQSQPKRVDSTGGKAYGQKPNSTDNNSVTWRWPTQGRLVESFSLAERGNKGIDIAGQRGQPVLAAAAGRVVYAGSALRGYGNLVIIKHDEDYLSAYAYNERLHVAEQQEVSAGQKIADMGNTDAPDVRLHFEIRYRGKSVNPMQFLPKH